MTPSSDRTYLHVPPEERAEVEAAGASWDSNAKCWYITGDNNISRFESWLPDTADDMDAATDPELEIYSGEAYIASARVPCRSCGVTTEIICIHCASGIDGDEPLTDFTVSNICAMDDSLTRQLAPWPRFKRGASATAEEGCFTNHCSQCNASQEEMYLHDEPGDPFFSIPYFPPPTLQLTPIVGPIRLSGTCHFPV